MSQTYDDTLVLEGFTPPPAPTRDEPVSDTPWIPECSFCHEPITCLITMVKGRVTAMHKNWSLIFDDQKQPLYVDPYLTFDKPTDVTACAACAHQIPYKNRIDVVRTV